MKNEPVGSHNTAAFAGALVGALGGLIVLFLNGGEGMENEAVVSSRLMFCAAGPILRVGGGGMLDLDVAVDMGDERDGVLGLERIDAEREGADDSDVAGRFGFTGLGVGGGCRREFERYISVGELVSIRLSSGQNMGIDERLTSS